MVLTYISEESNNKGGDFEFYILKDKDKKGFCVRHINETIGKGVFTTRDFRAGDFLLEYSGELISVEEARRREKSYSLDLGSFLFFFRYNKKELCIDATFSKRKGRYVNDGYGGHQNSFLKIVTVNKRPHLAVFASRNIKKGEEIRYDYGVKSLPWRNSESEASTKKIRHRPCQLSSKLSRLAYSRSKDKLTAKGQGTAQVKRKVAGGNQVVDRQITGQIGSGKTVTSQTIEQQSSSQIVISDQQSTLQLLMAGQCTPGIMSTSPSLHHKLQQLQQNKQILAQQQALLQQIEARLQMAQTPLLPAEFSPDTVKESVEVVTDSKLLPCTETTFENSMSKSPEIIIIDPDDSVTDNSDEAAEFSPDAVKESVEAVTDNKLLPCTETTFENSMSKSPEIIIIDPDDSVTDNSDEAGVFTPYTVKESMEIVIDSRQLPSTVRTSENFVPKRPEIMIIDPNDSDTEDSEEAVAEKGDQQWANSLAVNHKNTKLSQRIPPQTAEQNLNSLLTLANQISRNTDTVEPQTITSKLKCKRKKRAYSESRDQNKQEKKMKCLLEDGDNKASGLAETGRSQTRNSLDKKLTSDDFDPEFSNLSVINFNDLVPKSPIISASENVARQETFTLSMPPFMGKFTEGQSSKKVKLSEGSKSSISNSHQLKTKVSSTDQLSKGSRTLTVSLQKEESKKTESIAQCLRDTYVSEIPLKPDSTLRRTSIATETAIETQLVDHYEAKGEIENPFKPKPTLKRTPEASGGVEEKSKEEKGKENNQSQTKAKSKIHTASKAVIATSLQKSEDETVVTYPDHVENLFKPTQNLLGSPSPADELYSKPFLTKMCNNVDSKGIESEPLLVSRFADKKTTYISTDMDITAPLSVSDKRSHFINSMEQTEFQDKDTRKSKTDKTNAKLKEHEFEARKDEKTKCKKICQNSNTVDYRNLKHHENLEQRESLGIEKEKQKALDEMRIDNSGEFSFTASRKEADCSRKPVLETILSSARSKKKQLTPEKDLDPNIGPDRDIYNFGNRTPIILLDKILEKKESSLNDLSINESVIFRTASPNKVQCDLQESVETGKNVLDGTSTKDQLDCSIYHCPLKGSLGGKPKQTRGRPKSRTRSKSRSRKLNDSDDGDCVPYWSRSNSRSRKNSRTNCGGFYSPRSKSRTRGRSRTRKCVDLSDKPGSRSIRSKSQTWQPSESESTRTMARIPSNRARSKIRIKSSRGSAGENVQSKSENEDPENKSKDNAKDKVNIAKPNVRDSDSGFQNKIWQRRKWRRHTKVNKETDGCIDSDTVDYYELKSKKTKAASSPVKDISNKMHHMERPSDDASYSSLLCSDMSSNVANKCGRSLESGLKGKRTKDKLNLHENEGSYIGIEFEHVAVENNRKTGYSGTLISNFHPAKHTKMQTDEDIINYRSANSEKEHKTVTTEEQLNLKSPGVQNIKAGESSESVKKRSKQVEENKITKSVINQSMSELEAIETPDKEAAAEEENVCGDKMPLESQTAKEDFKLKAHPEPIMKWYHDDSEIQSTTHFEISYIEDGTSLSIPKVFQENAGAGKYKNVLTNTDGSEVLESKQNMLDTRQSIKKNAKLSAESALTTQSVQSFLMSSNFQVSPILTSSHVVSEADLEKAVNIEQNEPTKTSFTSSAEQTSVLGQSDALSSIVPVKLTSTNICAIFTTSVPKCSSVSHVTAVTRPLPVVSLAKPVNLLNEELSTSAFFKQLLPTGKRNLELVYNLSERALRSKQTLSVTSHSSILTIEHQGQNCLKSAKMGHYIDISPSKISPSHDGKASKVVPSISLSSTLAEWQANMVPSVSMSFPLYEDLQINNSESSIQQLSALDIATQSLTSVSKIEVASVRTLSVQTGILPIECSQPADLPTHDTIIIEIPAEIEIETVAECSATSQLSSSNTHLLDESLIEKHMLTPITVWAPTVTCLSEEPMSLAVREGMELNRPLETKKEEFAVCHSSAELVHFHSELVELDVCSDSTDTMLESQANTKQLNEPSQCSKQTEPMSVTVSTEPLSVLPENLMGFCTSTVTSVATSVMTLSKSMPGSMERSVEIPVETDQSSTNKSSASDVRPLSESDRAVYVASQQIHHIDKEIANLCSGTTEIPVVSVSAPNKQALKQCSVMLNKVTVPKSNMSLTIEKEDHNKPVDVMKEGVEQTKSLGSRSKGISGQSIQEKKKKPHRPCPYCLKPRSNLTGHLKKMHKKEPNVNAALCLPKQDQNKAFCVLKRKGIMKANLKIMNCKKSKDTTDQRKLIRERTQGSGDVVYCSKCYAFVSKSYFFRHKRSCMLNESSITVPDPIPSAFCSIPGIPEDFNTDIRSSFLKDDVGKICASDKLILGFGIREFQKIKIKSDKRDERRASLKKDMRSLGRLFKCFREAYKENSIGSLSAEDMFQLKNFKVLQSAVIALSSRENGETKSGLKIGLGYLIKKVAKYIQGEYLVNEKEKDALQIEKFISVLKFQWPFMFGDAEYSVKLQRQTSLRKPQNMPIQGEVDKLRHFTVNKIKELVDDSYVFISQKEFSLLRDLVICRLTLFNARRGGEPSRLLINEWKEAKVGTWISDIESVEDCLEKHLLGKYRLAYQPGKRDRLVPLLIIEDCWKALDLLCAPEIRTQALILESNNFVFPCTKQSPSHVLGWQSVKLCCQLAGLNKHVTATSVRHLVSTLYASLEVPESDRKAFFDHMGHSEFINKNVYQSPLAVKEVTHVGKFLDWLDKGGQAKQPQITEHVNVSEVADAIETEEMHKDTHIVVQSTVNTATTSQAMPVVVSSFVPKLIPRAPSQEHEPPTEDYEHKGLDTSPRSGVTFSNNTTIVPMETLKAKHAVQIEDNILERGDSEYAPTEQESDEEVSDTTNARPALKKRRKYIVWKPEWAAAIKEFFTSYIEDIEPAGAVDSNKGHLPGVKELRQFIGSHPEILREEDLKTKIYRIKSKIFNERKLHREKLRKIARIKRMTIEERGRAVGMVQSGLSNRQKQ